MFRGISTVTLLSAVLLASAGAAQQPEPETIIVSAARTDTGAQAVPGSITVITAADITASGASHLVDVLRTTGGLQVSDLYGDGTDASVGLRGFSETAQQNTLIMIDGRRLNNADNGLPDLNSVALGNIERIEIVRGSAGPLYGDKAVGGVINIITREPDALHIDAEARYGSYDNRSLFAALENRHSNGLSYRVSGGRTVNDNYRANNRLLLTDVNGRAGYEYAGGRVFAEYQYLDENLRLPGALFRDLAAADPRQSLNPGDYLDTVSRVLRAGLRQQLVDAVEFQMEYTRRTSTGNGQLSSGGFPSSFHQSRRHTEYTPRLIGRFQPGGVPLLVTLGGDVFITDYLIRSDFGITDDTQTQYSVYLQAVASPGAGLTLSLGGRRGRVKNDILVDTLAFGRSLPEGSEIDDGTHAWEAGLSYDFNDRLRLYAKLDRNYRFVTADEYSAVADNNFFADLFRYGMAIPLPRTQTGLSWEFGAEWKETDRGAMVQFFQLDLDNEIVFDPTLFLNTNIGSTRRRGVILEARYAPAPAWEFTFNYSFLDTGVTGGSFRGAALTFVPDHTATLVGRYRYNDHLSGYLELTGVSARVFGGDFANAFGDLPGYVVGNLNLSWQQGGISLALRVNNLLDRRYSDSGAIGYDYRDPLFPQAATYFPAPGRNYLLTLRYSYH